MNPQQIQSASREADFRQCFKCNYEALSSYPKCPRCRSTKFFTSGNIRTRGVAMIAIGIFLAGLMTVVAAFVYALLLSSKNPDTIRAVNKGIVTLLAIYAVFGMLILLGMHFTLSGVWMLVAGKRSRVLLWIMWALLLVTWLAGGIAVGLTGE